jgi:hypothetical protein
LAEKKSEEINFYLGMESISIRSVVVYFFGELKELMIDWALLSSNIVVSVSRLLWILSLSPSIFYDFFLSVCIGKSKSALTPFIFTPIVA